MRVCIVGIGYTPFRPTSSDVSFREMIYRAAVMAYQDAKIEPKDVSTFISVSEDFTEGTSIFDEYVPDQLGATLKPVHTIAGCGLTAVCSAFLQIQTGMFKIAVVEGHSKASNILNKHIVDSFALDPIYIRPLRVNPISIAALEMNAYLNKTGLTEVHTSLIVEKNKKQGIKNALAPYGENIDRDAVLNSEYISYPIKEKDVSLYSDGAIVVVLADESTAKSLTSEPVYIRGVGWAQDTPNIEMRDLSKAVYSEIAAQKAYRMAGIKNPKKEIDFAEIDDTYSFKEIQHIQSVGLAQPYEIGPMIEGGYFCFSSELPVNPSGGALSCGNLYDANGLRLVVESVLQLRGRAGERQIKNAQTALLCSWRGIPTASGAVVVLSNY